MEKYWWHNGALSLILKNVKFILILMSSWTKVNNARYKMTMNLFKITDIDQIENFFIESRKFNSFAFKA